MRIAGRAYWREARPGKNGANYVNGVDSDTGGDIKITFDGKVPAGMFQPDGKMKEAPQPFEAVVRGQTFNLAVNYHVVEWLTPPGK